LKQQPVTAPAGSEALKEKQGSLSWSITYPPRFANCQSEFDGKGLGRPGKWFNPLEPKSDFMHLGCPAGPSVLLPHHLSFHGGPGRVSSGNIF
jgi:hypothetical protein